MKNTQSNGTYLFFLYLDNDSRGGGTDGGPGNAAGGKGYFSHEISPGVYEYGSQIGPELDPYADPYGEDPYDAE